MSEESSININGYKERTFDEIRSEIENEVNQLIPELKLVDNTLVSNLIDVSSVILKQQEGLIKYLFNGVSYPSTSNMLFDLVSRDYGVSRHPSAESSCDIKVVGTPGYVINVGTQFTNSDSSVIFYTTENSIINSVGECVLNCLSDSLQEDLNKILIGDINSSVIPDKNIKSVSNISIPSVSRDIETIDNFKLRIQERIRNIVQGSPEGLLSSLKEIEGVDPLLVNLNIGEQEINGVIYNGVEAIVSGGDPTIISSKLLDYCGLNTKVLISNPSNSESNRTIEQSIKIGSSNVTVKFTRPKILNFGLKIKPKFKNINITSEQITNSISENIIKVFNNLSITESINKTFITEIFVDELSNYGIKYSNIISVDFEYTIDGQPGSLDQNEFVSEKQADTWLKITNFEVEIQR